MKTTIGLSTVLAILAACAAPDPGPAGTAEGQRNGVRPNFVLVLADDQGWSDSGAYGNPDVRTPNIDRLAAGGMSFSHAFTATAMCAPTRQQLYTGLYPVRSGAFPQNSFVREGTRSLVHYFRELGYRVGISGKRHYAPRSAFPFESLNSEDDNERPNLELIRGFVERDPGQPYFLVVASRQPHTPWNRGDTRYDPGSLTVPGNLVDTPEMRRALAEYYREVSDFDAELGRVLDVVDASGAAGRTVVIYTSEQGAMLPGGKWTLYDGGVRTAFVVRWPGVVEPSSRTDAMVAYVDVLPTLVEAAGGEAPAVDGESFLGVLEGRDAGHRDHVFGVHTSLGICNGGVYPIRSVRTRDFKLIRNGNFLAKFSNNITARDPAGYFESWRARAAAGDGNASARVAGYERRPALEFYDLRQDPLELDNVAHRPEYADEVGRMGALLEAWQEEQGDRDMLATERAALEHILPGSLMKLGTDRCGG